MVDIRLFINQILPITCLLCHSRLQPDELEHSMPFCRYCWSRLPWLGPHCQRCASPMTANDDLVCGHCQQHPPPWNQAHALFKYQLPINMLIQQFKYQQRLSTGIKLGQLWSAEVGRLALLDGADMVVPVPLHWRRQWRRGYNQVMELLRLAASGPAIQPQCLQRIRHTHSQTGMKRNARTRNMRHAFQCQTNTVNNKRILLMDDVMTTGATLQAATLCLLDAGASQVDVMVLARSIQ